jgi:hypothetical protein
MTGAAGYWFPGCRFPPAASPTSCSAAATTQRSSQERTVDRVNAFHGLFGNRWSWAAIALSLAVQLLVRRVTQPRPTPDA